MKKVLSVLVVLFISFQLNAQWVKTTNGPYGTVNCLSVSGTNIYAGTNIGVYLSTNNGANWIYKINGLNNNFSVYSLIVDGTNIYAGTTRGVFLSTDIGTSLTQLNNGLADTNVISLAVSGNNVFAGAVTDIYGPGGVFHSTNNGASWTQANNGLNSIVVNVLAVSGANIIAATHRDIFLSADNGTNWTKVNNGPSGYITSLATSGTNVYASTDAGIYLSTNNGVSWILMINEFAAQYWVNTITISGTNFFVGTNNGVYLSMDNGINWTQAGLANSNVVFLAFNGTYIFAITDGAGAWRRPLSELTGVSKDVKTLPQEYTLFQNYPNPFNPSTVIKYAVPFESNVNIRFYNSLGQTVREVSEGNRQPGNYEINFNSSGLASGIYFYTIKALSSDGRNDFSAVKKMIVLK